jgi:hypothetical protein
VLGRQSRRLAVGLAVRPGSPLRLTATVVGPTGRGVDGLDVRLAASGETDESRPAERPPPSGEAVLRRATRAFRSLDSAVYEERLGTGRGAALVATWTLQAPDRFRYEIEGGGSGIVIGESRWDRAGQGAGWVRSQTTRLPQPVAPWGATFRDARVLRSTPDSVTLSWLDPELPAWFTGTFDRRTALPRSLRMTAAAHFMRHRYERFDGGVEIVPPS